MLGPLIDRYKNYRKQAFLNRPAGYTAQYAFVGAGAHSLNNLYPVLNHLAVPLKYIATRRLENAEKMAQRYVGCTGTTDLAKIEQDKDVQGVFICTAPGAHFALAERFLKAGKKVFVEKPPALTTAELEQLAHYGPNCLVGVQKRYAPAYLRVKKAVRGTQHYTLTYRTGAYPEGDPRYDLYLHPVDLAVHLFGPAKLAAQQKNTAGTASLVLLAHATGAVGSLELSTAESWQTAAEHLRAVTKTDIVTAEGTRRVTVQRLPRQVAGVPLEKVRGYTPEIHVAWEQSSFLPVAEHNALVSGGYYAELEAFINFVESGKAAHNKSTPQDLLPTYRLLAQL